MASRFGDLNGSGNQQIWLNFWYISYNQGGNYSTWGWDLRYYGNGWGTWGANINWSLSGFAVGSGHRHISSGERYDTWTHLGGGTFNKGHDSNGYLSAGTLTGHISSDHTSVGSGSVGVGTGTIVRIPKSPAAPSPVGLDQILPTSMRYRFSGNSNNGASIIEYQAQIASNTGFTQNLQTVAHPSSGERVFSNLIPGTKYYARSRGRNSVGWGGWSSVISADTLAGGRVKNAGVWANATPWEKVNGTWVRVRPFEKQSGTWRAVR